MNWHALVVRDQRNDEDYFHIGLIAGMMANYCFKLADRYVPPLSSDPRSSSLLVLLCRIVATGLPAE